MILERRNSVKYFIAACLLVVPQMSLGWGQDGHHIVAAVGSKLSFKGSQFWNANIQNMVQMTSVPDLYWKAGNLHDVETVTHFFQPDSYFSNPSQFNQIPTDFKALSAKVGSQVAIANGSSPWRTQMFYDQALAALKNHDFKNAVIFAGVMSHYIGDMSQPLHVSENYDGQMTNDKGIHKFFETDNITPNAQALLSPVTTQAQGLLHGKKFSGKFDGNIVDESFAESFRAWSFKDQLIQIDLKQGRKGAGAQAQLTLATSRLADGAATLATILSQLWEESGLNDVGSTVQITVPAWIQPDYYATGKADPYVLQSSAKLDLGDDCGL